MVESGLPSRSVSIPGEDRVAPVEEEKKSEGNANVLEELNTLLGGTPEARLQEKVIYLSTINTNTDLPLGDETQLPLEAFEEEEKRSKQSSNTFPIVRSEAKAKEVRDKNAFEGSEYEDEVPPATESILAEDNSWMLKDQEDSSFIRREEKKRSIDNLNEEFKRQVESITKIVTEQTVSLLIHHRGITPDKEDEEFEEEDEEEKRPRSASVSPYRDLNVRFEPGTDQTQNSSPACRPE